VSDLQAESKNAAKRPLMSRPYGLPCWIAECLMCGRCFCCLSSATLVTGTIAANADGLVTWAATDAGGYDAT
jgi:hypothetical protein